MRHEDQEQMLTGLKRWGGWPSPAISEEVSQERERRGTVTLAASIRAAKLQRSRKYKWAASGLAVAALVVGSLGFVLPEFMDRVVVNGVGLIDATLFDTALFDAAHPREMAASGDAAQIGSDGESLNPDEDTVLATRSRTVDVVFGSARFHRSLDVPGSDIREVDSKSQPLSLLRGDSFRAAKTGATLAFAGITQVELEAGTSLTIKKLTSAEQTLVLSDGEGLFEVDPKRKAHVNILAGGARVEVTGTRFVVKTGFHKQTGTGSEDDLATPWTKVTVDHGRVKVHYQEEISAVSAGETWSSEGDDLFPEEELPAAGMGPRHRSSRVPRDNQRSALASSRQSRPLGSAQPAVEKSLEEPSLQEHGATTLAQENNLFRSAITARNQGSAGRCVTLLNQLLSQHPSTPLRQEASVARFRCQASAGQQAQASQSAARYLAEYPSGFARAEARQLVLGKE